MTHQSSLSSAPMPSPHLQVLGDGAAVAKEAAARWKECATSAVLQRGSFRVALAGGTTPRALYELLASQTELPWERTCICFGDERAVPPEHRDSNARLLAESLLARSVIRPESVHRMLGELQPAVAAESYERTLRELFPGETWPSFDLVLLGLGADGHTASLFPHTEALRETERWVCANYVGELGVERLTLTFPALNAAREIIFLVTGAEKAEALAQLLEGAGSIDELPARGIRPARGRSSFLVDEAAAGRLHAPLPR